ncbi:MAG TPA: hypothetical protein VIO84_03410, partial [Candidatus Dormibacteraeota bacterium]
LLDSGPGKAYSVTLISSEGKVVAKQAARLPDVFSYTRVPPATPLVSASGSRAYFLDGNGDVRYVAPDGRSGLAVHVPEDQHTAIAFAPSPDDSRIAVSTLTYAGAETSAPVHLRMWLQDLDGRNVQELFSSDQVTEWPVGWHAGNLVVGVGPAWAGNAATNPYNVFNGYHVVSPASGDRIVTMATDCSFGPLIAAGTACARADGGYGVVGWDGAFTRYGTTTSGALFDLRAAPDGSSLSGRPGPIGTPLTLYARDGSSSSEKPSGVSMGWIDPAHVVYVTFDPGAPFARHVLDIRNGSVTDLPDCECGNSGVFAGTVPAALG